MILSGFGFLYESGKNNVLVKLIIHQKALYYFFFYEKSYKVLVERYKG